MSRQFGEALKEWRRIRRISQLDLGLQAGVSSRHISFLETGRSRPSRGMVLRLCDQLEVPRAARNRLLTAAGMAPAYGSRAAGDGDLAPVRAALDWMLQQHAPYPAMALDRHWRLTALNPMGAQMLGAVELGVGDSLIEALAEHDRLRESIVNLAEVIHHAVARLRTELAHFGHDPVLERAIAVLAASMPESGLVAAPGLLPAVIPTRYRLNGLEMAFFSTIAQFGTAEDVAISELKIELLFPADTATRQAVMAAAGRH